MTIAEVKELYKGEYAEVEVYEPKLWQVNKSLF